MIQRLRVFSCLLLFLVLSGCSRETKLLRAVSYKNDVTQVKELLEEGLVDINCQNKTGDGALTLAVKYKNKEAIELLLKYDIDLNTGNDEGRTPLYYSIINEDIQTVRLLLKSGVKPSLLETAAKINNNRIVQILLESDTSSNISDESKNNSLFYAVKKSNLNLATLLVDYGADAVCLDDSGNEPLYYAVGTGNIEITKLLIESGADIHKRDQNDKTILMKACESKYVNDDIAALLINLGADVNAEGYNCETPLLIALSSYQYGIVELLLKEDIYIDHKNSWNYSALMYAIDKGNMEMAKLLISSGADYTYKCYNLTMRGTTPMEHALDKGLNELLDYIEEFEASTNKI